MESRRNKDSQKRKLEKPETDNRLRKQKPSRRFTSTTNPSEQVPNQTLAERMRQKEFQEQVFSPDQRAISETSVENTREKVYQQNTEEQSDSSLYEPPKALGKGAGKRPLGKGNYLVTKPLESHPKPPGTDSDSSKQSDSGSYESPKAQGKGARKQYNIVHEFTNQLKILEKNIKNNDQSAIDSSYKKVDQLAEVCKSIYDLWETHKTKFSLDQEDINLHSNSERVSLETNTQTDISHPTKTSTGIATVPIGPLSAKDFRSGIMKGMRDAKNMFNAFTRDNKSKKKNKLDTSRASELRDNAQNDFETLDTLVQAKEYDKAVKQWESMRTKKASAFQAETHMQTYHKALEKIHFIKANPKAKKYDSQVQEAFEDSHKTLPLQRETISPRNYLSLQNRLQDYIDNPPNILPHTDIIPLVQELREQIREVSEKSYSYLQNPQYDYKRIQFDDHITDINNEYKKIRRKFGKFKDRSRSYNKEEIKEIIININTLQQANLALAEYAFNHMQQTTSESLSTFIKQVRRKQ